MRSIDGKMAEEKKKVRYKIHCFLSIKQTIRQKFVRIFVGISNFFFFLA